MNRSVFRTAPYIFVLACAFGAGCSSSTSIPRAPVATASPSPGASASPTPTATATATATASATPTATAKPAARYVAIGASDAVGIGASVPCGSATPTTPSCTGGTGYVPVLAGLLASNLTVTLDDLGISGAVVAPDIRALGNMYGELGTSDQCQTRGAADAIPGDFQTDEYPALTGSETLITIFAGGNDTLQIVNALGCGAGGTTTQSQQQFISTWITNFGNDLQTLVLDAHSKSPNAKIVIANLPNFALIPVGQAQSAQVQQALAAVTVGIDQNVIDMAASFGFPVVDLLCDSNSYVASNFSGDGFHPDDAGYAAFAQLFYSQINAATPAAPNPNCSYASQSTHLRQPLTQAIPAFDRRR